MSDDLDLGVYRDSAVRDRKIRRPLFVLTYAIANPLTNLVLTVVIVWFASNYARALIEEWYWSALLFVAILIIITPVSIYALKHVLSVIDGEPVFGKLGGLPRGMYRTIALAASHMDVRIADEHRDKVRDFTQLDLRMMHDEFQARYEDLPEVAGSDKADFETIWKDQILKFRIEGAKTFGELFGGGNAVGMLAVGAKHHGKAVLLLRRLHGELCGSVKRFIGPDSHYSSSFFIVYNRKILPRMPDGYSRLWRLYLA